MSRALHSLPSNVTETVRVLARLDGRLLNVEASRSLTAEPFENALPIREFFAWPGKRNYEGLWWSSTMKRHTGFESLLERQYLLSADHDPDVVGVSSQPLAILWPKGTQDAEGRRLRDHVPDFFVRLSNGDGRLVDVRHPDKAEAHRFALTGAWRSRPESRPRPLPPEAPRWPAPFWMPTARRWRKPGLLWSRLRLSCRAFGQPFERATPHARSSSAWACGTPRAFAVPGRSRNGSRRPRDTGQRPRTR